MNREPRPVAGWPRLVLRVAGGWAADRGRRDSPRPVPDRLPTHSRRSAGCSCSSDHRVRVSALPCFVLRQPARCGGGAAFALATLGGYLRRCGWACRLQGDAHDRGHRGRGARDSRAAALGMLALTARARWAGTRQCPGWRPAAGRACMGGPAGHRRLGAGPGVLGGSVAAVNTGAGRQRAGGGGASANTVRTEKSAA